jgi:hypothetical protein
MWSSSLCGIPKNQETKPTSTKPNIKETTQRLCRLLETDDPAVQTVQDRPVLRQGMPRSGMAESQGRLQPDALHKNKIKVPA